MIRAFTFEQSAVLVRHWFEVDMDDSSMEHGARVELRRLSPQPLRGSASASQRVVIDTPVWRVDLFDRLDAPPGNYKVAHFHPEFAGDEPQTRVFSEELNANPLTWLTHRFEDIPSSYAASGVVLSDGEVDDAELIKANAAVIVDAVAECLPTKCTSNLQCWTWTSDVQELVRAKIDEAKHPETLDTVYLAPWMT
jgi:hypothetical protein